MASWHPYNRNGLTGTMCLRYEGFSRLFCVLLVRPLPNTGADGRISACKARFTSFLQLAGRLPVGHRRFPVRFQCAQQPAPVRFQHRINRLAPLIALACLFPRMRFLTLAFDLFNSRQSFYILCPLRDTDADSLQGFPRYTSLHHPLANVSKSRGQIRYSEGAFFGCTCFSKGGCFPLKSTIPRFDMIGHWERQYREGGLDALSWGSPSRHNKMKKNQSPEATSQSSKNDARSREELLEELNFFRMENADLKKLEVLAQTKKQAAHESERKSCLS